MLGALGCAGAPAGEGRFYHHLVGEGGVEGVRRRVGLLPGDLIYDAVPQPLQREPNAEDDVVGARYPQRTVGLEDALRFPEPPHVEFVILRQALRANRVTTLATELPGAARKRQRRTRSPQVKQ
jgi:hypothetical protein